MDVLEAYLRTCAVSKSIIRLVWSKRGGGEAAPEDRADEDNVTGRETGDREEEDEFTVTTDDDGSPAIWGDIGFKLRGALDVGMHLMFRGVVADIMDVASKFMRDHNLEAEFHRKVNGHLAEIQSLRLDWCRTKTLPNVQWQGEDEIGIARVMPFVYGQFFLNMSLDGTSTSKETCKALTQVFHALHVMISELMRPETPEKDTVDMHVKIFLSCCHRFEISYRGQNARKKPFWGTKGNFTSLLNLEEQIQRYGSVRWYWDGTRERFIQIVKQELTSMRKTESYFRTKLIRIHRRGVIEWLRKGVCGSYGDGEGREYNNNYYRYESLEEIESKLEEGEVISAFQKEDFGDDLFVMFGRQLEKCNIVQLKVVQAEVREECGMKYTTRKLGVYDEEIHGDWWLRELEKEMTGYCLLLPFICDKDKSFEQEYAAVYDDWKVGGESGEKVRNKINPRVFETDILSVGI